MSSIGGFGEREKRLLPDQESDIDESKAPKEIEGKKKRVKVEESSLTNAHARDEVAEEVFSEDGKRLSSQEPEEEPQSRLKKAKPAKGKDKAEKAEEVAQNVLEVKSKRSRRRKSADKAAKMALKRERTAEDDKNDRTLKGTKLSSKNSGKTGALAQRTLEAEKSPLEKAAELVADKDLRAELLGLASVVAAEQKVDFVTTMALLLDGMPEKEGGLAFLQCVREIAHDQRANILCQAGPLLKNRKSDVVIKLVEQIAQCPYSANKDFLYKCIPYLKEVKDDAFLFKAIEGLAERELDRNKMDESMGYVVLFPKIQRFIDAINYKGAFGEIFEVTFSLPAEEREQALAQAIPILREIKENQGEFLSAIINCPIEQRMHLEDAIERTRQLDLPSLKLSIDTIVEIINSVPFEQRESVVDAIKCAAPLYSWRDFFTFKEFIAFASAIPMGQRNDTVLSWAKLLLKSESSTTRAESTLNQIVRMAEEQQKRILQRVKDLQTTLQKDNSEKIVCVLWGLPAEQIEKFIAQIERLLQGANKDKRDELLRIVSFVRPEERLQLLDQVQSFGEKWNKLSVIRFFADNTAEQIQDIKDSTESYLQGMNATQEEKIGVYLSLARVGVSKSVMFGTRVEDDATDQRKAVIAMAKTLLDGAEEYASKMSVLEAVIAIAPDERADVLLQAGPWLKGSSGQEKADIVRSITRLRPDQRAAILVAAAAWEPKEGISKSELIKGFEYINLAQIEDIKLQATPFYDDVPNNGEKFKIFQIIAKGMPQQNRAAILSFVLPLLKESSGSDRIALLPRFQNFWPEYLEEITKKAEPFLADADPSCKGHIFLAIAEISDDKRDAVLSDVWPWIQGITDIERANAIALLAAIPADRRSLLLTRVSRLAQGIESPQARLELLKNNAQRMSFPEGYDSVYKMDVAREDLKNHPLQLLDTIAEKIEQESAYELRIYFMNEPGIDAGGLGKEFISELFEGIKTKMQFKECSNGLYRPMLPMKNYEYQPLSDEEKQHYYQLGQLMMFCLNAKREYPIGMLFDQAVFTMLTKLQPKHFEKLFDELIATEEGFTELFAIYEAMNSDNEEDMRSLNTMKSYLASEETREQTIETIQSIMKPVMVPIIEIALGMMAAPFSVITWEDIQAMRPSLLSELLQGVVTREMIIEKLEFDSSIPQEKQQWMREWINEADYAKIQRFLFALTGARALGNKGLTIGSSPENVHFHTCTNTVELPLDAIPSQQEFNEFMELALTGTEKYSRG